MDLCRLSGMSLRRGRSLAAMARRSLRASPCEQPGENAQADELLDRWLEHCSPSHRELLKLRAMGIPLAEIAARTGFHEGSIRRIFYDLARRLDVQDGEANSASA